MKYGQFVLHGKNTTDMCLDCVMTKPETKTLWNAYTLFHGNQQTTFRKS